MAETSKRLGRGLSSLFTGAQASHLTQELTVPKTAEAAPELEPRTRHRTMLIPVRLIVPNPQQPRQSITDESVTQLAESINRNGLIQPVVVREISPSPSVEDSQTTVKYELIAGERRFRAARQAGLSDLPAVVRDATPEQVLELALIENIQREDLNAIEKARAYQQMKERFGWTPQEIGERVGEDRSTVTNTLRLLELPGSIQEMVAGGLLSMGHARALAGVKTSQLQLDLAKLTVMRRLSVRELEGLIRRRRDAQDPAGTRSRDGRQKRALIRDLEDRLTRALQCKVTIRERPGQHKGTILIDYRSIDEFQRICEQLGITNLDEA